MQWQVNGERREVPPEWREDRVLFVLREAFGLVGAKYGCGAGQCGACTVLLDGEPVRSCVLPAAAVGTREITTVEGLARGGRLHPVQQAWLDEQVAQCGYCQAGQIVSAVALLRRTPRPDAAAVESAMDGHLCRCGTQQRVRAAIARAVGEGGA